MSFAFPQPTPNPSRTQQPAPRVAETRQQPRLKIPAMYSVVRVRPAGEENYRWSGHIYDVSMSGMRFELDDALEPGTHIEVRGLLPGQTHIQFNATGRIVRYHDEGPEVGPTRMGMIFEQFETRTDESRLADYLGQAGLRLAA
ncbi:MAG: PilZ domain-containing protein [Algisphaera sp.]